MKILITGGAGYIGSITNRLLQKSGFETVVFDNLSEGHRGAVGSGRLIEGDLTDKSIIERIFKEEYFDAVLHFAAKVIPSESIEKPYEYFYNNLIGGLNLLEAMRIGNCKSIIFSSSCSVYGYPKRLPVAENEELKPVSVYGETKVIFESILSWYEKIYGVHFIALRYFNAAGSIENGKLGEDHKTETHIIPIVIKAALEGNLFKLYGKDYNTPDGTCIRDYIHVADLANAHILALKNLIKDQKSAIYNLGSEKPYSNKEVINMVKKVSGINLRVKTDKRRKGDPAIIYADTTKIKSKLGWRPKYSDLENIISTAYEWHRNHPNGYES